MCAVFALPTAPAHAQNNGGTANGSAADALSARQRDEIAYHAYMLTQTTAPIAFRREAADRLLAMNIPAAHRPLEEALRGTDAELRTAVLDAIEVADVTPTSLMDAVLTTLTRIEPARLDRAAAVLARFGEPAVKRVAELALNRETEPALRLRLIQSLGSFRSAEIASIAADTLVTIINPERQEPANVVDAVYNALRRLTNLRFGQNNYEFWSAWWNRNRNQPAAEWLPAVAQEANEQRAALERQMQELQRRLDDLERIAESRRKRLEEAINQIYFFLSDQSNEQKLEALAAWLDEPLTTVRRVAMVRIDGLVRNNEPVGDAVIAKLVGRLKDSEKELRAQAAQLLDALNHPRLGVLLAEAIAVEQDPATTTRFIEILQRRPAAEAVPVLIPLLTSQAQGELAARALVAHVDARVADDEQRAVILDAITPLFETAPTPTVVRLFARTAPLESLERVEPLLAHEAEPMRRAAAESLDARNAGRQALIDHHTDPVIFPYAVTSQVKAGSLNAFNGLLAMTPPTPALRDAWLTGLRNLAAKLTIAQLAQADTRLVDAPAERFVSDERAQLREAIMQRIAATPPNEVTPEHAAILLRLARLRLANNRPDVALEALDRANGQAPPAEIQPLRFEALMRLARYDDAARVFPEPGRWISLLVQFIDQRPDTARAVATEIERRFPDLNGDAKTTFEAARARLKPAGAEAGANGAGGSAGGEQGTGNGGGDSNSD